MHFSPVTHMDAHRAQPLDEDSALMLAQHFAEYAPIYAYFTDLQAIDAAGFRNLFSLFDRMRKLPILERNLALGQVYSLLELDALLSRRHVLNDAAAAKVVSLLCERFLVANDGAARASASMAVAEAMLAASSTDANATATWDDRIRKSLLGSPTQAGEPTEARGKDYREVLDALKVPSLDTLHTIDQGITAILNSPHGTATPSSLAKLASSLPSIDMPKQARGIGNERETLLLYSPTTLQKLAADLDKDASSTTPNPKTIQRLAFELRRAMEPQITAALAGQIYAWFLRSDDLMVAEDPLLLRKHHYFDYGSIAGQKTLIVASDFTPDSEGIGSYFTGSFAQFGLASAQAAAAGWRQGGAGGKAVIVDQIAAVRSASWDELTESDQRLASLRILGAREWIVQAAQDPAMLTSLDKAATGVLSASRRATLLNGIEDRDWARAWATVTLPDLFAMGASYLNQPDVVAHPTAISTELHRVSTINDGARLDALARIPSRAFLCDHAHRMTDAPYEEYDQRMSGDDLAERAADFKLYLAYRADSLGIEPADAGRAVEALSKKALRASQMNDSRDWRSLLAAYAAVSNADLAQALER